MRFSDHWHPKAIGSADGTLCAEETIRPTSHAPWLCQGASNGHDKWCGDTSLPRPLQAAWSAQLLVTLWFVDWKFVLSFELFNFMWCCCLLVSARHTSVPIATAVLENTSAECLWEGILQKHPVPFWSPLECKQVIEFKFIDSEGVM